MTERTTTCPDMGSAPVNMVKMCCRCGGSIIAAPVLGDAIEQGTGPGGSVFACQERTRGMAVWAGEPPVVGKLARDHRTDMVGEYMGMAGQYAMLRPVGGGREWQASPSEVEPLPDDEALSLCVRVANERSRGARM
jgi:hypothetical protein